MKPKQILLALPLLCLAVAANCQRTTYNVGLNSGIFRYTGDNAFEVSAINVYPELRTQFGGTPGKKTAFSYEITGNIQRITKSRIIFGMELAWQSLQTKTNINGLIPTMYSSYFMPTTGNTRLTNQFISLTPVAGYRLLDKKIKVDLTTGLELAACISRKEKIDARNPDSDEHLSTTNDLPKNNDLRVRLQLNTSMGRFGLTTGYAAGLTNFYKDEGFFMARSSFIRLGLNYRLF